MPLSRMTHPSNSKPSPAVRPGRRSKLFVPGNRPLLMAKALAGPADSLSLDLEDAVPPAQKEQARAEVRAFLSACPERLKEVGVRVNSLGSGLLVADLLAIGAAAPDLVNVPKVEDPRDLQVADEVLRHVETSSGLPLGTIKLVPTLESPAGLRKAWEIARASTRVVALQFGMGDLKATTGMHTGVEHLRPVRVMLLLAAAELGLDAMDSAYADIEDLAGFEADAFEARRLGFRGKSCIHPTQVDVCNRVFSPTPEEVADARELLMAFEQASSQGAGAIRFRGRLVDEAHAEQARRLLGVGR